MVDKKPKEKDTVGDRTLVHQDLARLRARGGGVVPSPIFPIFMASTLSLLSYPPHYDTVFSCLTVSPPCTRLYGQPL